jgi:predicted NodU family carbamoyl transferase
MAGEALVETPEQAVETFEKTNIDILWFPEKQIILRKTL